MRWRGLAAFLLTQVSWGCEQQRYGAGGKGPDTHPTPPHPTPPHPTPPHPPLQELCGLARHLQATQRNSLLEKLVGLGLFEVMTEVGLPRAFVLICFRMGMCV